MSALRLGSPGAEVASPADATARGDADSKHAAPPIASRSPASPGGLARGLSAMRDELETLAPKPPRHRASPTKPEGRSGGDGFELADDTVEYYAARLEALAPLTSAERGDFDALYAAYPEAFGERDARDAFALAATRLRDTKRHVYTRALETSRVLAGLGMRSEVIAAALLHGAMDADVVGVDEARARCGVEAASMAADAARLSLFSALARASADEAPLAEEDKRRFRSMLIAMTDARRGASEARGARRGPGGRRRVSRAARRRAPRAGGGDDGDVRPARVAAGRVVAQGAPRGRVLFASESA